MAGTGPHARRDRPACAGIELQGAAGSMDRAADVESSR